MPVTAPPRPHCPDESVESDEFDALVGALIEEARQRARRRRRIYGAAAALAATLLALAGIAAFTAFDGGGRTLGASSGPVALPTPPNEDATLVAHYSKFHFGWVLVYADGRVLTYRDAGALVPQGGEKYTEVEQRLSPAGVDLVRSGAVEPDVFLGDASRALPADAWADAEGRRYVPTRYAVLYWGRPDTGSETGLVDASRVVDRLPEPLRAVLRGKERTYTRWSILSGSGAYPSALENSEVTAEEARALRTALTPFATRDGGNVVSLSEDVGKIREVFIDLWPIFPHGEWAIWLG